MSPAPSLSKNARGDFYRSDPAEPRVVRCCDAGCHNLIGYADYDGDRDPCTVCLIVVADDCGYCDLYGCDTHTRWGMER